MQYWEIRQHLPIPLGPEDVAPLLRARLESSIRKRVDGGQVGVWLSGGLDSATMAALTSRYVPSLHTFAVGVEGAPDLEYARRVADSVGTRHHERICTPHELAAVLPEVIFHLESFDALLVRSSVTNYLVGKTTADYVPAVLSGEGGDELFAGYEYLKDLSLTDLPRELVDITKRLHNTALQRVDRCSAAHGLVARTAFLDRGTLELALRIAPEMKIRTNGRAIEKWILRKAMDGLLPDDVLERPKAKFWEGAGVGELLCQVAEEQISDFEFAYERGRSPGVLLRSKEELYYYRIFREMYPPEQTARLVGRSRSER